ncbi:glycerol-3-phosphate dehydrogenase/oxidase [Bacillus aquiflavi]|uniref:glycerol-3-phosphate dehydrogenase/oxidase n=1 Tax=Bacillus aquiflavi TaxID=2672567 RepID=UPI001CA7CA19|nr:glycerol-3-phosphate dehydrogenase/oxidase [Bacillus aquiflavi]UAC49703.1 glycerol-3-phosphate dehydrogenase/oxidase [Bacillus aquiflavi]
MEFSARERKDIQNELQSKTFDVLIIGGGITGAGIALDAVTRGMTVALVEMQDFAAGTSSRSTKLVHGGLRYLKQFEVGMVAEVGKERAIVYENGPHVTTPEWMLLPIHKGGTFGKFSTSIGLKLYDFLAGVKSGERRQMLTDVETLNKEALIKKQGLKGGGYYVEYRTDDARLTIEVLKKAVEQGAVALNYSKVTELIYKNNKVAGASIVDQQSFAEYEINAKKVVNAAGPWVDTIREKDQSKEGKMLQLTKGVHLVIDQSRFPLKQAVYFDTPDGRMVFAIPRSQKTYVGTTDTVYDEDIAHPNMTSEDRTYLINAINFMFPDVNITEEDVESSWAGVRPLIYEKGKSASEISRKDEIWESESQLITIAGGKLTGYRKMAETVVNLLVKKFADEENRVFHPCQTRYLTISGGDVGGSANLKSYVHEQINYGMELGLTKIQAANLTHLYGSNVQKVFNIIRLRKEEMAASQLPVELFAKLTYAIEEEMATTPVDFFNRRTGDLLFNIKFVHEWKDNVISFMEKELSWTPERTAELTAELNNALKDAVIPVDLLK